MLIFLGILLAAVVILMGICLVRAATCPKTIGEPIATDPARAAAYAEKLSAMVRCETVSRRGDTDTAKFLAFHKVLEEQFPTVFARLEKIELDGEKVKDEEAHSNSIKTEWADFIVKTENVETVQS